MQRVAVATIAAPLGTLRGGKVERHLEVDARQPGNLGLEEAQRQLCSRRSAATANETLWGAVGRVGLSQ